MLPAVIDHVTRATPRSALLQIAIARPFAFSAGQAVLIGAPAPASSGPIRLPSARMKRPARGTWSS